MRHLRALGRGGLAVGSVSFGAAPIGNLGREVSDEDAYAAIDQAWSSGVRCFDVAPHYGLGLAERRIGRALAKYPRDEYIISSKVGRLLVEGTSVTPDSEGYAVTTSARRRRDYSREGVLRSVEDSLLRLGLDRLDVVYVHDPDEHFAQALDGAFPALESLRSAGVITSYGAGMNSSAMLASFIRQTDSDVVMCAGRYTLLDQSALDDLLPLAVQRQVSVVAAGVFNSGILARPRPRTGAWYDYTVAKPDIVERAHRIADTCEEFGSSLPTAAAQLALLHPAVATVCIGARNAEQMQANMALFDKPVPQAAWQELKRAGLLRRDAPTE